MAVKEESMDLSGTLFKDVQRCSKNIKEPKVSKSVERSQDLLRSPLRLRPSGMPMSVPHMHLARHRDFALQWEEFAMCRMSRKGIGCIM